MKNNNKRTQFFEVALKLFHEKGFKATTMRDIADRMGFKVANIYNYIDSKESLLEMYLFGTADEYHTAIDNVLASSYSPREKLRAVIAIHVHLPASKPYHRALLTNEWRNLRGEKREQFIDKRREYDQKLKALLIEGMDAGEIRTVDPSIATQVILSSVRWIYWWYAREGPKPNPVEMEKQVIDMIFRGLGE